MTDYELLSINIIVIVRLFVKAISIHDRVNLLSVGKKRRYPRYNYLHRFVSHSLL